MFGGMSILYPIPRGTRETTLIAGDGQVLFGPITDWQLYDAADLEIRITNPGEDFPALLAPGQFTAAPASPAIAFPAFFTLTLAAPVTTGASVNIRGVRVPERSTDVTRGGRFQSQSMELELDRITVVGQELRRDIDRGFMGDDAVASAVAATAANAATALAAKIDAEAAAAAVLFSTAPTFVSRTAMSLATIAGGTQFALVADTAIGFVELYGKIATPGLIKTYHLQSADGAWWTPTGKVINLATWGVPMNGTDAFQAVQDVLDKVDAAGGGIVFHPGGTITNVSKQKWLVPNDIIIFGVGDISKFKANGMTVPMFQSNGGVGLTAQRRYRQHIRDFAIDNTVGPAGAGCIGWDWRNVSIGSHTNIHVFNVDVGMQFYADAAAGAGCYYIDGRASRIDNCNIGFDFGPGGNENTTVACSANVCNIGLREADTSHNVHVKFEAAVCATYNIQVTSASYDCNLISPRIENIAPANGTGIKIASTAVNTVVENPQYTNIATRLDNASLSTKVNGRKSLRFTVDRGSISANSTDDYAVSLAGFARDADAVEITPNYSINAGLIMQAIPSNGQVYSRTANVTAGAIDPPSMSHLLTWWKPGGD